MSNLLAAKASMANTPATSSATPTTTTGQAAPGTEKLSEFWKRTTGNTVNGQMKSITSIGSIARGNPDLTQYDERVSLKRTPLALSEASRAAGKPLDVKQSVGGDESAKLQTLMMTEDMFDAAEKAGLKTSDDFRTAFESLKNASPRTRALSTDPKFIMMTQTDGADLKNVLAELYGRTYRAKQDEMKNATSTNQSQPTTKTTSVKLKVAKK